MDKKKIEELVIEIAADIMCMEKEEISCDSDVKELGANSIDRMDIVSESLEKLNLDCKMVNFANYKTIGALVEKIFREMNDK